jgi:hypothetical protein
MFSMAFDAMMDGGCRIEKTEAWKVMWSVYQAAHRMDPHFASPGNRLEPEISGAVPRLC